MVRLVTGVTFLVPFLVWFHIEFRLKEGVDGGIDHGSYIFSPHPLFGFTLNSLQVS
jgi:hypothetical protein